MAQHKYETTELGLELRSLFIAQKNKSTSGKRIAYAIPGELYQDCFEKVAEIVTDLKTDPEAYIYSQFYNRGDGAKILPQFLYSEEAVQRYLEFANKQNIVTLDDVFNENVQRLKNQMSLNFTVEEILMSKSFDFRPWFRVCITKEPVPAIMEKFQPLAKEQFNDSIKAILIKHNLDYKRITL